MNQYNANLDSLHPRDSSAIVNEVLKIERGLEKGKHSNARDAIQTMFEQRKPKEKEPRNSWAVLLRQARAKFPDPHRDRRPVLQRFPPHTPPKASPPPKTDAKSNENRSSAPSSATLGVLVRLDSAENTANESAPLLTSTRSSLPISPSTPHPTAETLASSTDRVSNSSLNDHVLPQGTETGNQMQCTPPDQIQKKNPDESPIMITPEQRERIERNRQAAIEKQMLRRQRSKERSDNTR